MTISIEAMKSNCSSQWLIIIFAWLMKWFSLFFVLLFHIDLYIICFNIDDIHEIRSLCMSSKVNEEEVWSFDHMPNRKKHHWHSHEKLSKKKKQKLHMLYLLHVRYWMLSVWYSLIIKINIKFKSILITFSEGYIQLIRSKTNIICRK